MSKLRTGSKKAPGAAPLEAEFPRARLFAACAAADPAALAAARAQYARITGKRPKPGAPATLKSCLQAVNGMLAELCGLTVAAKNGHRPIHS